MSNILFFWRYATLPSPWYFGPWRILPKWSGPEEGVAYGPETHP
jgi:hypothetical protein